MRASQMLISIAKRFSWDSLESNYSLLDDAAGPVDLKLPINVQNLHFGGAAALLQLVATWIRTQKNGDLYTFLGSGGTFASQNPDEQIDRFLEHPHSLIASCNARKIFDHNNGDITEAVRAKARQFLKLNREHLIPNGKGLRLHLLCDDSSGFDSPDGGFHPFFYDRRGPGLASVRNVKSMGFQIRALLERQVPLRSWKPDGQIFDQLGVIIHELFDNTHVWARDDLDRRPLTPSYRGALFNCHNDYSRSVDTIAAEIGGKNTAVSRYLRSCVREDNRMLPLLEITVFDCGPTLPARAGRDIYNKLVLANEDEEYDVAIRAFLLWTSSSAELNRGRGLERVLRAVSRCGGFLLLRTAHLNVYRDLQNEPFSDASAWATTVIPGKHPLRDLIPRNSKQRPTSFAAGTFVTLLIPLKQRQHL